jgi:hypothetical protein
MAATPPLKQDGWRPARLISVAGIRGQEEQEQRATSSLLAVMHAVPEFGYALLGQLGAPKAQVETFTEIPFANRDGKRSRPDGAILVERGRNRWSCLVEVKTGGAQLKAEQVSDYLEIARDSGFDGVLTVSNEITRDFNTSPVAVDRRKTRKTSLWHLSWWEIMTEAILQHRFHKISDPDQAWILGELIAYLDHENSDAGAFQDMGDKWVAVRDGARNGTLRPNDPELPQTCARWEQFVRFLALGLSQDLGRGVTPINPRKQTPEQRLEELRRGLTQEGRLTADLRVPDAIGPLRIEADLRARTVTTAVLVQLPSEGRPLTRVNWLLRQLKAGHPDLRLTVGFANIRQTSSALLGKASDDPSLLLAPNDPKREPRWMQIAMTRAMGTKRGRGQGSFVGDTRQQTIDFYGEVVQTLRAWRPNAPRLTTVAGETPDTEVAQPEPPAFSLPYGRLPGEASEPEDDAHGSGQSEPG